jgi:ribose transport system substrate-binding protein
MKHFYLASASLLMLTMSACSSHAAAGKQSGSAATASNAAADKCAVAFTVPTLDSAFFTAQGQGAKAAADMFGVQLTYVGANLDVATQISQVEDFIQKGVKVLVIQAADSAAIVPALTAAEKAGVPVVETGDKSDSGKVATLVGFDSVESGTIGGKYIGDQLNGQGNVVELIGRLGTDTGRLKSQGLKDALGKYPGIKLVASQAANFDRATAVTVMENIIQAQPKIDAVYAANDDMALGALQALTAAGRKDVLIVGNDGITDALTAVKSGKMSATIATPPFRQGFMGVEVAHRLCTSQAVPSKIQEQNVLVTKANVDKADAIMTGVAPADRYWESQFSSPTK